MFDVFLTVDSRHRDKPSDGQGDYTVRLQNDMRGVNSVTVRSADIPSMWNIPRGRSSIWVSHNNGFTIFVHEIVIEPGAHTTDTAAAALLASLNTVLSPFLTTGGVISVNVTPLGRFEISMPFAFSVQGGDPGLSDVDRQIDMYGPSSAGLALGLSAGAHSATRRTNDWLFTAAHVHNLDKPEQLYLHIEDYDAVKGVAAGVPGCTEVIRSGGKLHDRCSVKTFVPPLQRIDRLRVRITDHYGKVVDFDNRDHTIELVFNIQEKFC